MSSAPPKAHGKVQSSIAAWLRKPAAVTKPDLPAPPQPQPTISPAPQHGQPQGPPEPISDDASPEVDQQHLPSLTLGSLPSLPANVELVPLTEALIPSFKRLTALTLPIAYPAVFFTESMEEPYHSITLMALWHAEPTAGVATSEFDNARLVGAIRCRILPSSNLYISTLGLLSPYRSYGIATHLLQRIIVKASKGHGVKCVTAHVWEANDDGMEWYKKRGFEIIGKEEGYYRKLKPQGAILVRKRIGVTDLLGQADPRPAPIT